MSSSNTQTVIANMALGHLGNGQEIANLDTERTQEAIAMRRFYATARDEMLREFPWPFATGRATLGLVEEDPNDEWAFSYRYPSDCVKARRIVGSLRNETRQSRVPYKIEQDATGILLLTDMEDAILEYTVREEDASLYPPDFVMALSLRLAAYTAPKLTRGDAFKMGDRALKFWMLAKSYAQGNAANEQQDDELPDSEFIRSRE